MKQKIGTVKDTTDQPITDLDMVFLAIYNILYEKAELEPKKGLVAAKGKPNQRKATWYEILYMAHMLEDYFRVRENRTNQGCCEECKYWYSVSGTSPHLGYCRKHNKQYIHKLSTCKKWVAK